MPKSKATSAMIGHTPLVDSEVVGGHLGFTSKYINRLAAENLIPWHGVKNGSKVYRRFDLQEVVSALAHGVEASDGDDASPRRDANPMPAQDLISPRRRGRPPRTTAPAAHEGVAAPPMNKKPVRYDRARRTLRTTKEAAV